MSGRSIRRTMLGVALACGLGAAPASAHAPVVGTFPAKGATVAPVRTVSVRFANDILTGRIDARAAAVPPSPPARRAATRATMGGCGRASRAGSRRAATR